MIFDQTPQMNNSTLFSGEYNDDGIMVMVMVMVMDVLNVLINELCQKHSFEFRVPQYTPLPVRTLQTASPFIDPFSLADYPAMSFVFVC